MNKVTREALQILNHRREELQRKKIRFGLSIGEDEELDEVVGVVEAIIDKLYPVEPPATPEASEEALEIVRAKMRARTDSGTFPAVKDKKNA